MRSTSLHVAAKGRTCERLERARLPSSQCTDLESPSADQNDRLRGAKWLLRKEVIQPHLPVRLPCYDLVLITDPTFDGSLHKGWATGFRCYRLS